MKTLKTTFEDVLHHRLEDGKKMHVPEEVLYEITLGVVVLAIVTSGLVFTLAF
jgi:hypothetical protein